MNIQFDNWQLINLSGLNSSIDNAPNQAFSLVENFDSSSSYSFYTISNTRLTGIWGSLNFDIRGDHLTDNFPNSTINYEGLFNSVENLAISGNILYNKPSDTFSGYVNTISYTSTVQALTNLSFTGTLYLNSLGDIIGGTATQISVTANGYLVSLQGNISIDANGNPTNGTINALQISDSAGHNITASGMNLDATTFEQLIDYPANSNLSALFNLISSPTYLSGNDTIIGGSSNDTINGYAGNDILNGGAGVDTLIGGTGDDTYVVDSTTDIITEAVGEGNDTVQSSITYTLTAANVENLTLIGSAAINGTGSASDNALTGNSASNTLSGGDGNDTLDGGASDSYNPGVVDTLNGDAGNDTFLMRGFYGAGVFNGGTGTDTLDFSQSDAYTAARRINEGAGVSVNLGTGDAYTYYLKASGYTWNNDATGNGHVTLSNIENVTGTNRSDLITGDANANILDGGASDTYNPGVVDTLNGDAGNDTFLMRGFYGAGVFNGGTGTDTLDFSQSDAYTAARRINEGAGVSVNLGTGDAYTYYLKASGYTWNNDATGNGHVTLSNIENVTGTNQADILTGDANNNVLEGGAGADILNGGAGVDTLIGGTGDDTYVVDSTTDIITEAVGEGNDTVQSSITYTLTAANVENLTLIGSAAINGTGSASDNALTGNSASNTLSGGDGNDTLDGGASDSYNPGVVDTLNGDAGNDTFLMRGFYGAGVFNGGTGTDTLDFSQSDAYTAARRINEGAGVSVNLGTGDAYTYYLKASGYTWNNDATGNGHVTLSNIENVTGTNRSDLITGDANANILDGGASDTYNPGVVDTLNGDAGNDTFLMRGFYGAGVFNGGTGTDTLDFSQSDAYTAARRINEGAGVSVNLGTGDAYTYYLKASGYTWNNDATGNGHVTLSNIENVTGTNQADILTGDANNNVLEGGAGADILNGGAGVDTLIGGTGDDTYVVDSTTDIITEAVGEGNDTVQSSITYTLTAANVENLTLIGSAAINGTGSASDNALTGNSASNTLSGGDGNDTLDGGASDSYNPGVVDTLNGDAGNDTFLMRGFYGAGVFNGGTGTDTLDFSQSDAYTAARRINEGAGVSVNLGTGDAYTYYLKASGYTWNNDATGNGHVTLSNIENVTGTNRSDLITGDANANILDGGASDTYNPGVVDTLNGDAGNDTFLMRGFYGAGVFNGGTGTDTLDFSQSDAYTAARRINEGAGVSVNLGTGDAYTYYLKASGYTWNNDATGNGHVTLSNIENVTGTNQADILTGDANNNVLEGGAGADILNGGAGVDTFVYNTNTDSTSGSMDIITDFTVGTDFLDFSKLSNASSLNLRGLLAGPSNFGIWLEFSGGNTNLFADTSGDGIADMQIQFNGNINLQFDDVLGIATTIPRPPPLPIPALTLNGTNGNDVLFGNTQVIFINGLDGNDIINGAPLTNEVINGGNGDDTIRSDSGNDTIDGGAGKDLIVYSGSDATDRTSSDSILNFTTADDKFLLENAPTSFGAIGGFLSSGEFLSGAGISTAIDSNDYIIFNTTTGDLYFDYDGNGPNAAIKLATLFYTFGTLDSTNFQMLPSGSYIQGTDGNDNLVGTTDSDIIFGGKGNDVLNGGTAGFGDDLFGGEGNDTLIAGNGSNDVLNGGIGSDTLTGGLGADTFEWNLSDKGTLGNITNSTDTITDFSVDGGDKIDIRDLLVGENSSNIQNYIDIITNAGSTEIRISSTGGFSGGTYSAGAEDAHIVLSNVNLFTATGTVTEAALLQNLITNGNLVIG